jgi:hypothetical protein
MTVPYQNATSGGSARDEIVRLLRRFGCKSVGFMDDFEKRSLLLAFTYKGQKIQLEASAKGWAALFLRENPHTSRHRLSKTAYEQKALDQGMVAVNSVLRDWVKGQITAVECGALSFSAVFMPYMLTNNGQPLYERVSEIGLLEGPK